MAKASIYGAFFEGALVGKRTTRTMPYSHALVFYDEGHDQPRVLSWHMGTMNAQRARTSYTRQFQTDTLYVVDAVKIDKNGVPLQPAGAEQ